MPEHDRAPRSTLRRAAGGGGILVAINTRLAAAEVAYILEHSGASVLVVDPSLDLVEGDAVGRVLVCGEEYEQFLGSASAGEPEDRLVDEDEDAISINYTSGTTGFPKGVMYTHRGGYLNALGRRAAGLDTNSVYLWTLPLFHCNGWCFPWAVTAVGARHICLRQVDPARVVELIRSEGVTHLCGAPVVVSTLAQYCAANGIRFERGLKMVTAGAPPSPAVIRAAEEIGADVAHAYGLTETYGPHTLCAWHAEWDSLPVADRAQIKARQGVAYLIAGTDLRVVDPQMRDVPRDGMTMGEVIMRGNNVMLGYYNNPEATAKAFRGRLVPLRRPGGDARRWLHRAARPRQGHRDLGRREHFVDRGGEGARRASGGAGSGDGGARTRSGARGRRRS